MPLFVDAKVRGTPALNAVENRRILYRPPRAYPFPPSTFPATSFADFLAKPSSFLCPSGPRKPKLLASSRLPAVEPIVLGFCRA